MSCSSDDFVDDVGAEVPSSGPDEPGEPVAKKSRKETRGTGQRGKKVTVQQRMAQFPGEFFLQGEEMWCVACQCPVGFKESTTSKNHLLSGRHIAQKKKRTLAVVTPGPAATLVEAPKLPETSSPSPSVVNSGL